MRLSSRKAEPGYIFLVYSLFLAFIFPAVRAKARLSNATLNLDWIHFLIIPAYLYYLDRHDSYYLNAYSLSRYQSWKRVWQERLILMLKETISFSAPYILLQTIVAVIENKDFRNTSYALTNWLFLLFAIGVLSELITFALPKRHLGHIVVFVLLTLDYLQYNGSALVSSWAGSAFYHPLLGSFKADNERIIVNVLAAAGMVILLLLVSAILFFPWRKQRHLPFRLSPGIFWGILAGIVASVGWGALPDDIETLWLWSFGGYRGEAPEMVTLLLYLLPFVIALLLWGSVIPDRLASSAVLLFSRSQSRKSWWCREVLMLGINYLLYFLMQLFGAAVYALIAGAGFRSLTTALQVGAMLFLTAGSVTFSLIVFFNAWGLGRDPRLGLVAGGSLWLIAFFLPYFSNEKAAQTAKRLFLPYRGSLLLHDRGKALESFPGHLFYYADSQMLAGATALFAAAAIVLIILYGNRRLHKMDIL